MIVDRNSGGRGPGRGKEEGMDRTKQRNMWIADQGDGTYRNPILYTDYSDPDAIRVGEDYFLIASSFCNAPAVPLLHSKDLVNWKVINYVMEKLPFPRYDRPQHGCGAWAPSIRFHDGVYYVFVPFPDEGILMCKTTDPWGKWSEPAFVRRVVGWIDPCPFWDDDGKAYMVTAFSRSRIGFNSMLYLSPIEPDASGVLDDGQFLYDGHASQPIIEGPKLYKRNGYYYIFAPAGGVEQGWQTVLRSRDIHGPYEERIVLRQGNSPVNGPHQGAWVDTPDGEDWFLHFQDVGAAGRILHLQPMRWEDDWPIIGENDADGCGEPVLCHRKPSAGGNGVVCAPEDSDFFEGDRLGLQWQWNANYREDWYRVGGGQLTLYAQPCPPYMQLCDVPNLLLQKWPAPQFQITVCIHVENMADGDAAGMVSQSEHYTGLFLVRQGKKLFLEQRTGHLEQDDEERHPLGTVEGSTFYLRMKVRGAEWISFEVGQDEEHFRPAGTPVKAQPGRWVGVKAGLAVIGSPGREGGSVAVDSFVFQELP